MSHYCKEMKYKVIYKTIFMNAQILINKINQPNINFK
jgi:hypothetical protein